MSTQTKSTFHYINYDKSLEAVYDKYSTDCDDDSDFMKIARGISRIIESYFDLILLNSDKIIDLSEEEMIDSILRFTSIFLLNKYSLELIYVRHNKSKKFSFWLYDNEEQIKTMITVNLA